MAEEKKDKQKPEPEKIEEAPKLKDCFIITPIGGVGSETFKKADGLIKSVIDPVLLKFGFKAVPAYDIAAPGSITKQVIERVINNELVIANLTGLNPNVMYELALRHAYKKKVITMAEFDTKLPFDISDQRTIFYSDTLHGAEEVKPQLEMMVEEVLKSEVTSNPVIDSVKEAAVLNSIGDNDANKYFIERLDRIEQYIVKSQSDKPTKDYLSKIDIHYFIDHLRLVSMASGHSTETVSNHLETFLPSDGVYLSSVKFTGSYYLVSVNAKTLTQLRKFKEDVLASGKYVEA